MSNETEQPNNAVLEVKLDFIQKDIAVIKSDVKEIKNDYLTRREFSSQQTEIERTLKDHENRTRANERFIGNIKGKYTILAVLGMAILSIVVSFVGSIIVTKVNENKCPATFICTSK
jgi:hypothetical protein